MLAQVCQKTWEPSKSTPSFKPDFHEDKTKMIDEFWIFELKIGEMWFGDFVNSDLFLTRLSGIDLHENLINLSEVHGWVSAYLGCQAV